jgi:3-oxoacyl-[acyl-carrier protein] reductase
MAVPYSKTTDMHGQVAFVTGAARGIGAAVCRTLADAGVDIAAFDQLPCEQTISEITERKRRALPFAADATDRNAVKEAVDTTLKELGRIDILVCSAGICPAGKVDPDSETWHHVLNVNVDGTFYAIAAVWPHMVSAKYGKIVLISSMAAYQGGVIVGTEYSASKAAVLGITRHVARNGGKHNIFCNVVAPGVIDTEMTKDFSKPAPDAFLLGRVGKPEDVAEPIRFLCSPASNYITGTVMHITGGLIFGS